MATLAADTLIHAHILNAHAHLKVPCHAFPVITRPLVCYEGFYAYKRSAKSQTLKVHPVVNKTLTQKIPAPERLVGDFSFSIVFFLGTVTCPYPNGPIRGAVTLCPRSR